MGVFIIEQIWVDPLENRDAVGYKVIGYLDTEEDAKDCYSRGKIFTKEDCWAIKHEKSDEGEGRLPEFRYKEIPKLEMASIGLIKRISK